MERALPPGPGFQGAPSHMTQAGALEPCKFHSSTLPSSPLWASEILPHKTEGSGRHHNTRIKIPTLQMHF